MQVQREPSPADSSLYNQGAAYLASSVKTVTTLFWDMFKTEKVGRAPDVPRDLNEAAWAGIQTKIRHASQEGDLGFARRFQEQMKTQNTSDLVSFYEQGPASFRECFEFCIESLKLRNMGQYTITDPPTAGEIFKKTPRDPIVVNALHVYILAKEQEEPEMISNNPQGAEVYQTPPTLQERVSSWWHGAKNN